MRRIMVVCLSFVCLLLLSLSATAAQEILYDTPAWVKGFGAIWFAEHTPDNSRIILATTSGLYLLNPNTPDVLPVRLEGHTDTIRYAVFSTDGSLMATSSFDGTVRLWRMPSGEAVWSAKVSEPCCVNDPPSRLFFTDDASLLIVYQGSQSPAGASVINVHNGKAQRVENNMFPENVVPRGNDLLYINQAQGGFQVYRLHANGDAIEKTAEALLTDPQVTEAFNGDNSASFTKDYAVASSQQGTLTAIHLKDGAQPKPVSNFPKPIGYFENTVWGLHDTTLSVLNLDTGERLNLPDTQFSSYPTRPLLPYTDAAGLFSVLDLKTLNHTSSTTMNKASRWSGDFLIYPEGTSIKLYNPAIDKTVTLDGAVVEADDVSLFTQVVGNNVLVSYGKNFTQVGIWDAVTGTSIVPPTTYDYISTNSTANDDTRIAFSAKDPTTHTTGILVADLKASLLHFYPTQIGGSPQVFIGDKLLYGNDNFALLDFTTGEETRIASEGHSVRDLAFSPDGKQLVTGGDDSTLRLWDANTGAQLSVINLPDDPLRVAYDELGIATLDSNSHLQFFNVPATSTPSNPVEGVGILFDIAFRGDTIVAAAEGNVQLFSVDTDGNVTAQNTLTANAALSPLGRYQSVAMSDRYIAAAGIVFGKDNKASTVVDLWDATSKKYIQRLNSQTIGDADDLNFSPDGTHLALSDGHETVVWNFKQTLKEPAFITSKGFAEGNAFVGNTLATVEQSFLRHSVDLYTVADGMYVGTLQRNVNSSGGGGGNSYRIPLVASPDGSHLALADATGELVMWNMPDRVETVTQGISTSKATIIPYCDTLGIVPVNPTQNQTVNLSWSWFATDIPLIFDHISNADYDIRLDGGGPLPLWDFQRSTVRRDTANDNNWTVYYSMDVGMLKPGIHTLTYSLTWRTPISDGIMDYGPNTDHPTDTGTCTFTVN